MLAWYMLWTCVCLSQVGVVLKWLDIGSRKQYYTIAQGLRFLVPKISAKFDRGKLLRGRQMQVGLVKIGNLRQITGYTSKTVQERRTVSIKVEWEGLYAQSNGDFADYLEWPQTTIISPFCTAFRIFVLGVVSEKRGLEDYKTA